MKKILYMSLLQVAFWSSLTFAQSEEIKLQFSQPEKPGHIKVHLINGSITVKGHSSPDILIRFPTPKKAAQSSLDESTGLRRIQATTPSIDIVEEDNQLIVNAKNHHRKSDLELLVPFQTSLNLTCVNNGNILVENIEGEIEAHNVNGTIELLEISGSVAAHAMNQNLVVTFKEIDKTKPMSFSSLNAKVDVTFPANLDANLLLETNNGKIYTAFDVELKQEISREEGVDEGRRRISYKSQMIGIVGKGGQEMTLKSFNGNIYIRKK